MEENIPKMVQKIWKRYGFATNPFDTNPLSPDHQTVLPISKAMVGRDFEARESRMLYNVLSSAGGGRVIVEGKVGVGKTTFVNYHRYLWENHAEDRLFTTLDEISITEKWKLPHFLVNLLASLLAKLLTLKKEVEIVKIPVFKEVLALSRVIFGSNFSVEGSFMGFGAGYGRSEEVNVPLLPEMQLMRYLREMIREIKNLGYQGVFLHIDNLELLKGEDIKKARFFFEEIRDSLQMKDVYFVFVASRGFFREVISPLERVRSIFYGRPVVIPPLSKSQVREVIEKRYQLLAREKGKYIPPVENSFIDYLHDLYGGKLRYIMDALNMLLPEVPFLDHPYTIPTEKAREYLAGLAVEQFQDKLTTMEWNVLRVCASLENFTNSMISRALHIPSSNAARILNQLLRLDLIYLEKKEGRKTYYQVTEYVRALKDFQKVRALERVEEVKEKPPVMPRKQRLGALLQEIKEKGALSHGDYVRLFHVSSATATRDLKELEEKGTLKAKGSGRGKRYYG